MTPISLLEISSIAVGVIVVYLLSQRLLLSLAKYPSLVGHARWGRRLARWVPAYEFDAATLFAADGADAAVVIRRREGFQALATRFERLFPRTLALTRDSAGQIPDLDFTSRYRVPFPFSTLVRRHLPSGAFLRASAGARVTDLDGNELYDLSGSYGVNLFGYDFYKGCIQQAVAQAGDLGPVLGAYHPLLADNVRRLCAISGLDAVSFHMSGTEAVMQAVRLARYHTRRTHLVRFCGAYHGWWGDVQPGVGNPARQRDTYTLAEMSTASLRVLRTRRDIACVLVNPIQALHPNASAPSDSALIDSSRRALFDRDAYARWLQQLRALCSARGIVLIFDEVFAGFRIARGGAQEYFGVRADMVTYGKSLGGGLPVGVLCGRRALMQRYDEAHPADICFARGTFNSHPYVMAAMNQFLLQLELPSRVGLYAQLDERWNARVERLNARLRQAELPVQIANLSSIWTVLYSRPARFNWMLQYYLRAEGLALSWVGSGRLIFSIDFNDEDFEAVCERFTAAVAAMARDGWWSGPVLHNKQIRRQVLREMLQAAWRPTIGSINSPRKRYSGAL